MSQGSRNTLSPLTGDLKATPSSETLRKIIQTEHLKPARVSQDGTLPAHEIMQITVGADDIGTGTKPKMEGITENDLRTDRRNIARQHALDRSVGANRHKCRRLHTASGKIELASSGVAVAMRYPEVHYTTCSFVRNMASP